MSGHPVVLRGLQAVCVCASVVGKKATRATIAEIVSDTIIAVDSSRSMCLECMYVKSVLSHVNQTRCNRK